MLRIRKGVSDILNIFYHLFVVCLTVYYIFDTQSVRDAASFGVTACVIVTTFSGACKLGFALWDRHLAKTRKFFSLESEGWQDDGFYSATLIGAQGTKVILTDTRKERIDAYIQKVRSKPFAYGFHLPLPLEQDHEEL